MRVWGIFVVEVKVKGGENHGGKSRENFQNLKDFVGYILFRTIASKSQN